MALRGDFRVPSYISSRARSLLYKVSVVGNFSHTCTLLCTLSVFLILHELSLLPPSCFPPHAGGCSCLVSPLYSLNSPLLFVFLSYTFSLSIFCQLINRDPEFKLGCGTSNQAQAVMESTPSSLTPPWTQMRR